MSILIRFFRAKAKSFPTIYDPQFWGMVFPLGMYTTCTYQLATALDLDFLFAFIASGFEHSVANMTLFTISLLGEHPDTVTIAGMFYNLFWVTLGNIVAGGLFMGLGYWLYSGANKESPSPEN